MKRRGNKEEQILVRMQTLFPSKALVERPKDGSKHVTPPKTLQESQNTPSAPFELFFPAHPVRPATGFVCLRRIMKPRKCISCVLD